MKIAFITESFPELSETFILGKAVELRRRGHEVTVFTQFKRDHRVHPDLLAGLDLGRDVVRLPAWDRVRGKDITRALAGAGAGLFRLGRLRATVTRSGSALDLVKALPFLRGRFDVIHAHYAYMGVRYLEVARIMGTPLVVSLLGTDASIDIPEDPGSFAALFDRADRFIAVVEYLKRKAVEHGCPAGKVEVIFTEVDTEFFRFVDRSGRRNQPPVVLTVGRLDWTKGYLYAIEAMSRLKERGVPFKYEIVGDGRDRHAIQLAIADYGLSDRVTLLGKRDREGVREAMARADVFFLASVIEGIGGVLLEAQATGLPVVTTRVGGLAEVVKDGETGRLAGSRDPGAMAERLGGLLEHEDQRLAMGRRGREWVEQNFDQAKLTDRLIALYEDVIQERPGR